MVVRSQRTGVDPRAGVARSHMLESHRNREHSEVAHTGNNNPGRSTLGNVFNRLGRGADMRDLE